MKTGNEPVQNLFIKNKAISMENAILKSTCSELRNLLYRQYCKTENTFNSIELRKERDQLIKLVNSLKERMNFREVSNRLYFFFLLILLDKSSLKDRTNKN